MPDPSPQRVTCPGCGKGYRWQDKLVGRIVPCKQCHTKFTVPDAPGLGLAHEPAGDGIYDLDYDPKEEIRQLAKPAVGGKCPSCNSPVKEHAVICLNCGFNMEQGTQINTAVASTVVADPSNFDPAINAGKAPGLLPDDPEVLKAHYRAEFIYPLIYLISAALLIIIDALVIAPFNPRFDPSATAIDVALATVVYAIAISLSIVLVLFFALLLLVSFNGSGFGDARTALLKVLAIALASAAVTICLVMLYENWLASEGMNSSNRYHGRVKAVLSLVAAYITCFPAMRFMFDADATEANGATAGTFVGALVGLLIGTVMLAALF